MISLEASREPIADSKTDMRWVIEQRPDIVEGYLSDLALLHRAGPDEIIGPRRRR